MRTKTALITNGGKGSRLRNDGVKFKFSKSFIKINGKPIFYWCLHGLYQAGVRHLIITADDKVKLNESEKVIKLFPKKFFRVQYFKSSNLGTTGLPYEARSLLKKVFFFETGHGINPPEHYRLMDDMKKKDNVVFSIYSPKSSNDHKKILVGKKLMDVGLPFLLDNKYAKNLSKLDFNIAKVIDYYDGKNKICVAKNTIPEEFDYKIEFKKMVPIYREMIKKYKWK